MNFNENDIIMIIQWFRANEPYYPFFEIIDQNRFLIGFTNYEGITTGRLFVYPNDEKDYFRNVRL